MTVFLNVMVIKKLLNRQIINLLLIVIIFLRVEPIANNLGLVWYRIVLKWQEKGLIV